MALPRQATRAEDTSGGRVNQKLRTRGAIVVAAQQLLEERGEVPTVAAAAEAALVSRTTAYRYFPTQESLVLELSVTIDVPDVEELAAQPVDADGVEARLLEVVDRLNRHVLADEELYRRAMRSYLDLWLAAHRVDQNTTPTVREGRRMRWLAQSLDPLRGMIPEAELRSLQHALCLVMGSEAMVVLRDVCRLDTDEALAVTRSATAALLHAAMTKARLPDGSS